VRQPVFKADDVNAAPVREAIADLKRKALATGQMNAPIDVTTNAAGTVTKVEIPLEGEGTNDASNAALATLRGTLLPETLGHVDGVEYAVTGQTAASHDYNQAQKKSLPLVFAFLLLFAFGLLLVTFRDRGARGELARGSSAGRRHDPQRRRRSRLGARRRVDRGGRRRARPIDIARARG
jgi:putative drug exporter of the RND superfamily